MAMRSFRSALITAATAIILLGAPVLARDKLSGEQQLAKMLEGRVAEKPVNCVSLSTGNENMTVIDKTALVYGFGSVIYVNRPTNADRLNSDDVLISHPTVDQDCRLDTVELRDRTTHFYDGFVGLQQFVPYRRVTKAN